MWQQISVGGAEPDLNTVIETWLGQITQKNVEFIDLTGDSPEDDSFTISDSSGTVLGRPICETPARYDAETMNPDEDGKSKLRENTYQLTESDIYLSQFPKFTHPGTGSYAEVCNNFMTSTARTRQAWATGVFDATNNLLQQMPRWAGEVVQAICDVDDDTLNAADAAAHLWRQRRAEHIQIMASAGDNSAVELPFFIVFEDVDICYNADPELERRLAITSLRSIVNRRLTFVGQGEISVVDAIFTMAKAKWLYEAAITMWTTPEMARRWIARFDQFSSDTQQLAEADRRLALFISITGSVDWYSAQVLLWNLNWNLKAALVHWYVCSTQSFAHPMRGDNFVMLMGWRLEIPRMLLRTTYGRRHNVQLKPLPKPHQTTLIFEHRPSLLHEAGLSTLSQESAAIKLVEPTQRQLFQDFPDPSPVFWVSYLTSSFQPESVRGICDTSLLVSEGFGDGHYAYRNYASTSRALRFSSLGVVNHASANEPEFDWDNGMHIRLLQKWCDYKAERAYNARDVELMKFPWVWTTAEGWVRILATNYA